MKNFNTTFKEIEINPFYNTRSFNTHKLKRQDFKIEKYGCFSTLRKCLSDWNLQHQNALKTNFKKINHSEIKNNSLINIQIAENKQLQINSTPYTSILLHCLLSFPMSFLSLSFSIFLFLPFPSFLFSFLSFCLHPHKN